MAGLGLVATELGPDGYLPPGAPDAHGVGVIGGFVPLVLHDPAYDPLPELLALVERSFRPDMVVVLAAATGAGGYEDRPTLDDFGALLANLDRIGRETPRLVALHPHVGTMIETDAEVLRVLDGSSIALCLDTGHLMAAGADPLKIAAYAPERVRHVHLKDVDAALAARVRSGELGYAQAVRRGMYLPLGRGDAPIAELVRLLERSGYDGWYVLEQDVVLDSGDASPADDVAASLAYLRSVT